MSENRPFLLFDVMDTLIFDPVYRELPAFFGCSLEELWADKHPSSWIEFERGLIDEATYFQRFFADGRAVDGRALKERMRLGYVWIEGMEELLAELRGRALEMHALSNYPSWYEMVEQRCGVSRYLPWTFVSCHTGVRKPHPEAYLNAARTLGRAPDQGIFIDDRRKNVAAAEAVGLTAILFEGAASLRERLHGLALL